jgi:hypothetical protein
VKLTSNFHHCCRNFYVKVKQNRLKNLAAFLTVSCAFALAITPAGCKATGEDAGGSTPPVQSAPRYLVSVEATVNGKITVSQTAAEAGTEIELTINAPGEYIQSLDAKGQAIWRKGSNVFMFYMPEFDVEVSGVFASNSSGDKTLKTLAASGGTWNGALNLSSVFNYELLVPHDAVTINFTFEANHIDAVTRTASNTLTIAADEQTFQVDVTAQDSSSQAYKVKVIRLPNPTIKSVVVTHARSSYSETINNPAQIQPNLPNINGAQAETYELVFNKLDSSAAITLASTLPGSTVANSKVTLSLNAEETKSGSITITAKKNIAGSVREASVVFSATLYRPGDAKYPSDTMATGGELRFIKTGGSGVYDELHIFKFDPATAANGQNSFTLKVNEAPTAKSVKLLAIAGGGAGGNNNFGDSNLAGYKGAGGGAGGVYYDKEHSLTVKTYSVKIGGGGEGQYTASGVSQYGNSGYDTVFDNITVKGGGGGSKTTNFGNGSGNTGGSSGGSCRNAPARAQQGGYDLKGPYFGSSGGAGMGGTGGGQGYGGGGGGAGGPGLQGSNSSAGGGPGKTWAELDNIITPTIIGLAANIAGIGGGGNGSCLYDRVDASKGGGAFGGGLWAVGATANQRDGLNGTGGGGGGGGDYYGKGGSGLVVVRFPYIQPADR